MLNKIVKLQWKVQRASSDLTICIYFGTAETEVGRERAGPPGRSTWKGDGFPRA